MASENNCDTLIAAVKKTTRQLRLGSTPTYERLSQILAERGSDVDQVLCVNAFDDHLNNFVAVILLEDGRAIECVLDYSGGAIADAQLIEWHAAPAEYAMWIDAGRLIMNEAL